MGARQDKRSAREQREHAAALARRRRTLSIYATGGLLAAIVVATLLAVTPTGSDDTSRSGSADATAQAGHIHGLGVNPADGSLYVATHGGLFRAGVRSTDAPRVGASVRDLIGFSVLRGDHLVASGHPASESGLRPQGIVRGQPVSFMAHGDAIYVALADGSVMQSIDGGGSFTVRARV
jgi:hypothetical protein